MQTARSDYPILKRPNTHLFAPTLKCLYEQTFPHKDFEFVVSDSRYEKRPTMFTESIHELNLDFDVDFDIKHIPVYSKWKDMGYWHAQANVNQGLIHTDGELIILVGDCCEFEPNTLQKFWDLYQDGYLPCAFVNYIGIGKTREKEEKNPSRPDHRFQFLKGKQRWYPMGQQVFGYNSYTLEAMLELNGADELFDGVKPLGDTDTGMRLERAGYKHIMDKDLVMWEHHHYAVPKDVMFGKQYDAWKYNYSLIILSQKYGRISANDYTLSDEDIQFMHIQAESMETSWKFDWDAPLHHFWRNNPPHFNLEELRNKRLSGKEVTYRW